jgi:hypothetical protein
MFGMTTITRTTGTYGYRMITMAGSRVVRR